MEDNKKNIAITDAEIINALLGKINLCKELNMWGAEISREQLNEILDLIKRKDAEIERLQGCVKSEDEVRKIMKSQMTPMIQEITKEQIDKAFALGKVNGFIEFAERIKEKAFVHEIPFEANEDKFIKLVAVEDIYNLVKEMAGENNA